ncbi:MAG: hypothetical protein FD130_1437 [Halothiobacillaceae bacterium]|nr:MAG: hypothetical protein FD130_1437 [Halothiobacillaceae bacterium]
MSDYFHPLISAIHRVTPPVQSQWLDDQLASLAISSNLKSDLLTAFTRARRFVGHAPLGVTAPELSTPIGTVNIQTWDAGNAARIVLLIKALTLDAPTQPDTVIYIYRMADDAEKAVVISGLALYANDSRYKALALEAGRTNSLPLFKALAVANPYPAAYYNEAEFNQLVLKSLFIGVNTEQIMGLAQRVNPTLSRMCEDYYDERHAAARTIPADIWLSIAPHASARGLNYLAQALNAVDPQQRYYAELAVARFKPPLPERLEVVKL